MKRALPFAVVAVLAAVAVVSLRAAQPDAHDAAEVAMLPSPTVNLSLASSSAEAVAVFAGGCFWGIEAVYEHLRGVKSAESGYAGGRSKGPSYEEVSAGMTGHAESVRVVYDPSVISYGQLLQIFFSVAHDPTQLNRQGPDVGTQYRSAIFTRDDEEQKIADSYVAQLTAAKTFNRPIVTEVVRLKEFYPAESYHQDYMVHHPTDPYIVYNDAPKLVALKKHFPSLYREPAAM